MALSVNEAQSIENRFTAIEKMLNDVQTALNKLATKTQMKSLLNIRQAEIEDLKTRLAAAEAAILLLQA